VQDEDFETVLWSAIRALKEKESLLRRMSALDRTAGDTAHADESDAQADRLAAEAMTLRRLLDVDG
jgi:BMFP domain-containing protein YqiC